MLRAWARVTHASRCGIRGAWSFVITFPPMVPALLPQPLSFNESSGGEKLQQPTVPIHQPVTLTGGFSPAHSDAIGVGLVLLAL